jgi:hypothetical protein
MRASPVMTDVDIRNAESIMSRLRDQCSQGAIRVTIHTHQEMVEEDISYESMAAALSKGIVVENYPDHKRGSCCLVCGQNHEGRFLHICCTTSLEVVVIITVYEPKPPKWITPYQRRSKNEM